MDEKHIIPTLVAESRFGVEVLLRKLADEDIVLYDMGADMRERDNAESRAEEIELERRRIEAAEARIDSEENSRRTIDPPPNNIMADILNRHFPGLNK
jgi:hypothetical protein